MKPYTWLLLDADDTLFDFGKAESKSLYATIEEQGLSFPADPAPVYTQINLQIWKELELGQISSSALRAERFARLFRHFGVSTDVETFSRRYLANLALGSDLLPGAAELLTALSGRYRLGLVTNGLPEVQRPRLERAGIAHYFAFAAISEEIHASKPDPRFFQAALALAGSPDPAAVLVIGDSLTSDIRGGCQAGLDTLWFNPANLPPDPRWPPTYQAASLLEIQQLMGR